jgi:hypothetical protein
MIDGGVSERSRVVLLCALFILICSRSDAKAQFTGKAYGVGYDISSLAGTDWALSTSGEPNPNNLGSESTAGNTWNLIAFRLESRIKLTASNEQAGALGLDSLSALIHPRLYADLAPDIDGNLQSVNLLGGGLGGGNYPGNGWLAQTFNFNESILDLPEAYVDLAKAGFKLRLGKQRIVWSPMLFVRVLDCVDGLDYRRHSLWGPVYEGFDDQRIGQWTANLTYQIPNFNRHLTKSSVQAFVSPDFEPTIYPVQGTVYSMYSSAWVFNNGSNIATARHKIVYGAAWFGTLFGVDTSLNFVSTPQINGVTQYTEATGPYAIPGTPYLYNTAGFTTYDEWEQAALRNKVSGKDNQPPWVIIGHDFGLPRNLYNPLAAIGPPLGVSVANIYPRVNILGGSISRYFERIDATTRLEVSYSFDKQFAWLWQPDYRVTDGEVAIAGMFRKEFAWGVEDLSPTTVQLEYWYKSHSNIFDNYASNYDERYLPFSFYMLEQPLMGQKLIFENTVMLDASQGAGGWVQPGVRYTPTNNWKYEVFYNFFWGGQRDSFGEFSSFDEIFFRLSYMF